MLRSLSIKFVMLATVTAAVLWIGWPVPEEDSPQIPTTQPVAVAFPRAPAPSLPRAGTMVPKVNLNRASVEELQRLPGVGRTLAQRMVDWRRTHGRYRSVDDLQAVKGIGVTRLERLRPLVTV